MGVDKGDRKSRRPRKKKGIDGVDRGWIRVGVEIGVGGVGGGDRSGRDGRGESGRK